MTLFSSPKMAQAGRSASCEAISGCVYQHGNDALKLTCVTKGALNSHRSQVATSGSGNIPSMYCVNCLPSIVRLDKKLLAVSSVSHGIHFALNVRH